MISKLTWSNGPVFVPVSSKSVAGKLTQTYLFLENAGGHNTKKLKSRITGELKMEECNLR